MPPIIETSRLVLRAPLDGDAETLVHELGNFKISRNTGRIPHPYHMQDARKFLLEASKATLPSAVWAICLTPAPATLVGVIALDHDAVNDTVELGYWLSESVWGNGYGSEAASAVVDHAFSNLSLEKLVATFHDDNPNSGRILKRLGFQVTGSTINFSVAQNAHVAATLLELPRQNWIIKKDRDSSLPRPF